MVNETVLPVYLVVDVSASMMLSIGEVNLAIRSVVDALDAEPFAADRVRLSIIAFSDAAEVVLPLTTVHYIAIPPELESKGGTSYAAALRVLRSSIDIDIESLKGDGYRVARPVAFFLTDGQSSDSWSDALEALTRGRYRPTLLTFGIGDADPAALVQLASRPELAFMAQRSVDRDAAIASFGKVIQNYVQSVSHSTQANIREIAVPVVPEFSTIPADAV